jgi:SRSO17 transposase
LYLPESWTTPAARAQARIPRTVPFREKWRQALTLFHQPRAAGVQPTAVLADAEFGDNSTFRRVLHRAKLSYAVGISSTQSVFVGTPGLTRLPAATGRPPRRPTVPPGVAPATVAALVATWPRTAWHRITWRNAPGARRCGGRFAAQRVAPAHDWRQRALAPEIWLLAEQIPSGPPRTKYYFVHRPPTASLRALVQLTHQRWAIEQQYQELKDELGLDHFEGRSWPGWHRHDHAPASPCRRSGPSFRKSSPRTSSSRDPTICTACCSYSRSHCGSDKVVLSDGGATTLQYLGNAVRWLCADDPP